MPLRIPRNCDTLRGMKVELGRLADGKVVLISDAPFPHEIRRVEFYREQRLMMLVYENAGQDGELMHHELPAAAVEALETAPTVFVVNHGPNKKLYGYDVPLVQIGGLDAAVS